MVIGRDVGSKCIQSGHIVGFVEVQEGTKGGRGRKEIMGRFISIV